ncbi:MAG: hypothetical protein WAK35_01710 [Xanthobacteraceae bacterium]
MYKIRDDGYANFKKIMNGRKWVGRVCQTADGFLGKIGNCEAEAPTETAALRAVVAKVRGEQTAEAAPESRVSSKRPSTLQADTERVIEWLRELSQISDGHPDFSNADVARTLGKKRPGQELSNLMSRLDFACYLAGLPSIGCTAEKPFADAWQQHHRSWKWPLKKMRAAAKAHSWSAADFDLILQETQRLSYGLGRVAWNDELAKNDNKIMAWAGA